MEFIRVEDCCDILDSQRKPITESERVPGMYPYYGANGIQGTINQYIFDGKLVLVAEDGGHFGSKTKPIAYLVNGKCWVNNHAHVLRAKKGFLAEYICYSLMFYKIEGYINGATRQKLTQAALRKLIIPKRPVEYQKAIVDRLDLVKCIIEKKQDLINELDVLIKSRFVEMFGDLIINSKCLNTKRLDELFLLKAGITTAPSDILSYTNSSHKYLCYGGNGVRGYVKYFSYSGIFPLIGRQGALCGNVQLAQGDFHATEHAILVKPLVEYVDEIWSYYALSALNLFRYHTGAAQPGISVKTLNNILLPIPILSEQKKFVLFSNQINKLKADVQKSIDEAQLLMDSLMQEYFG